MKLEVSKLLESLTEREEQVVRLSIERARQIRDGAMLKLRVLGRRRELKENFMYIHNLSCVHACV